MYIFQEMEAIKDELKEKVKFEEERAEKKKQVGTHFGHEISFIYVYSPLTPSP